VTEVLKLAKKELGEILAAFEYLDQESVDIAVDTLSLRNPLGINDERMYYIVLETRGSHHGHDAEKVEQFLELCMSKGVVSDGTIAQDATQSKAIWELRESVTEALRVKGATYKYDVSVPIYQMDDVVQETRERLRNQPDCLVVGYGHVADNNLHLNISVPKYSDAIRDMLEPWIYTKVTSLGGSISAEHGIGQMKSAALARTKPKNALHLMRDLKKTIDPKGIMNPYKIFTTL
jgi:D-2-hydroxyglutarate dehydrogenase